MTMTPLRRLSGIAAAGLLAGALVSCAPAQSVPEACVIAKAEVTAASAAFQATIQEALTLGVTDPSGAAAKFAETKGFLAPAIAAVGNPEVKTALQAIATAYDEYVSDLEAAVGSGDLTTIQDLDTSALESSTATLKTLCPDASSNQ